MEATRGSYQCVQDLATHLVHHCQSGRRQEVLAAPLPVATLTLGSLHGSGDNTHTTGQRDTAARREQHRGSRSLHMVNDEQTGLLSTPCQAQCNDIESWSRPYLEAIESAQQDKVVTRHSVRQGLFALVSLQLSHTHKPRKAYRHREISIKSASRSEHGRAAQHGTAHPHSTSTQHSTAQHSTTQHSTHAPLVAFVGWWASQTGLGRTACNKW